jgi:hypothetical protein
VALRLAPSVITSLHGCRGKVQNGNGVIHLIVEEVADLSVDLKRVAGMTDASLIGHCIDAR